MTWRPWTVQEDQRVVDMANAGASLPEVIAAIGRSDNAVQLRVSYLRRLLGPGKFPRKLRDPRLICGPSNVKRGGRGEQKPRSCLGCGHTFLSAHSMNRLCKQCRRVSAGPYAP